MSAGSACLQGLEKLKAAQLRGFEMVGVTGFEPVTSTV